MTDEVRAFDDVINAVHTLEDVCDREPAVLETDDTSEAIEKADVVR